MKTRRMLWASVAVAVFLMFSCTYPAPYATGPTRLDRDTQRAHGVGIEKSCLNIAMGALSLSRGSGVFISPTKILTAKHVTSSHELFCLAPVLRVTDDRGTVYRVKSVEDIEDVDVSIITLTLPVLRVEPISFGPIAVGDVVCIESRVPKTERSCDRVELLEPKGGPRFIHGAWVVPGNSGSGIYNTRGRLVGIVSTCRWDKFGGRCVGGGGAVSLWKIKNQIDLN